MSASAILKLQAAGFSTEQVTALAELIDLQAASKADLLDVKAELKTEIQDVRTEMRTEFQAVRSEIQDVRTEMTAEFKAVRSEIHNLRVEIKAELVASEHRQELKNTNNHIAMIKWVIGVGFAQVGLILGVIRLFQH